MPVRSLNSSVLKWPDRTTADTAVRAWAVEAARRYPGLIRAGYFGSYARGDWGVGSDLDLVVVVREAAEPFERRALGWDLSSLPVPAELLGTPKRSGKGCTTRAGGSHACWLERQCGYTPRMKPSMWTRTIPIWRTYECVIS